MITYLITGIVISIMYSMKFGIKHDNYSIGTVMGDMFGFSIATIFWPLFLIRLLE